MRLVPSTKCPLIDAELALHSNVVLFANEQQLVLLKHCKPFGVWYVCGFQSVHAARGDVRNASPAAQRAPRRGKRRPPPAQPSAPRVVPDAYYYWRFTGYVEEPTYNYALLPKTPSRSESDWETLYEEIHDRIIAQCAQQQQQRRGA